MASIASSSTESCSSHYIYLIQLREFIKTNEPVYKIGKTTQDGMNRIKQYPKGSRIILFMKCKNCHDLERIIKEKFIKKYRIRRDIGSEYFEGDEEKMYWSIIYLLIKEKIKTEEDSDESDEESDMSDTDISTDDKEDSDNMKEEEIVVSSYADYMKYSKIREIIITSKKTHEGYLRFDNTVWRYLHNIKHAERNGQETLDGFIRNDNSTTCLYRDTVTNKIGSFTDMNDSRHLRIVNINYRYDSIIKDIVEKCYQEHPTEFVPQYHQFFVGTSITGEGYSTRLFDAKHIEFYPIERYINGKYTTRSEGSRSIRTEGDCRIDIVDTIIRQLIPRSQHRNLFRTLCYAVLVDSFSSPYVFYDTCYYKDEHHQLSSWLSSITYTLGIESIPVLDLGDVSSKKSPLSEFIKENKDTRARCVSLVNIREEDIHSYVETIREKLGIMFFIVRKKTNNSKESIYDFNGYKKYMKENCEDIKHRIPSSAHHRDFVEDIDNIFYSTEMLFTNFLKWCVTH